MLGSSDRECELLSMYFKTVKSGCQFETFGHKLEGRPIGRIF